jgi:hypothetical protein
MAIFSSKPYSSNIEGAHEVTKILIDPKIKNLCIRFFSFKRFLFIEAAIILHE